MVPLIGTTGAPPDAGALPAQIEEQSMGWRMRWYGVAALGAALAWAAAGCSDPSEGLESSDLGDRLEAIRQLSNRGDEAAVERLVKAARHQDAATAREAVWALARVQQPAAAQALRDILRGDARREVRKTAARGLRWHPGDESRDVLRDVVRADRDAELVAEAAAALGRVGTLDDVALLVDRAVTHPDLAVQSRAVAAAGALVGLKFKYNSGAPAAERRKMLEIIRPIAKARAERLKKFLRREKSK